MSRRDHAPKALRETRPRARGGADADLAKHVIEQEHAGFASGTARGAEKGQQRIEGFPRGGGSALALVPWEGGGLGDRLEESFRCGRTPLDIYVLRGTASGPLLQTLQQPGAAAPAPPEHHRNPRRCGVECAMNPPVEPRL